MVKLSPFFTGKPGLGSLDLAQSHIPCQSLRQHLCHSPGCPGTGGPQDLGPSTTCPCLCTRPSQPFDYHCIFLNTHRSLKDTILVFLVNRAC